MSTPKQHKMNTMTCTDIVTETGSGRIPGERRPHAARIARTTGAPVLDVVVPVYNEQAVLSESVHRLHRYLRDAVPFPARITIADNASTDDTPRIAARLAAELSDVRVVRLEEKGRGRALHHVWSTSDAAVLVYTDVDLSTDLAALGPLVAPLISGHSDLAIGTRLARGAHVTRGPKREIISRCYNFILKSTLSARFSDAQCGFKAIRRDAVAAREAEALQRGLEEIDEERRLLYVGLTRARHALWIATGPLSSFRASTPPGLGSPGSMAGSGMGPRSDISVRSS